MDQNSDASDPSLPISDLQAVHKVCQQFEAEWKAGRQPKVADYLASTPEPQRSELKRELEAIEAEYRQKAKKPTLEAFIQTLTDSGLMTRADVQTFLTTLPADKRPADAETLAREMFRQGKLTRFQAQAIYQGKTRGLVVGNYVVLDKLGKGGMGQVYKAQHRKMKRMVALKMLPSSATRSPDAVKRFQREVEAAAKLSHPNIVTAHDADEANGVNFLVMEHVDGQDLTALVKSRGPLAVAQAVDCMVQAARGLEYAHRQGVIHRDIKPSNLLLDKSGVVKILDMGLARMDHVPGAADDGLTQTGQVMGTLDYMAPEQAFDTHQADARSDIYSLGCTLHYLLTGHSPFGGETVTQKILAHREHPIPSLRAVRPDVPAWLDGAFQKMLAKRPGDRQQTMDEVMTQLQQQALPQTGPAVQARPSPGNLAETLSLRQGRVETSSEQIEVQVPDSPLSCPGKEAEGEREGIRKRVKPKPWSLAFLAWQRLARRQKIAAATAVGLLFVFVLLGVVLRMQTKEGTLVVEIDEKLGKDVQVAVSQGGEKVQLVDAKSGWTLSLDAGKYDLAVQGGDDQFQLDRDSVTVRRGDVAKVKLTLKRASPISNPKSEISNSKSPIPPPAVAPFDVQQARKHQEAWAKHLRVPVEITNSIGMKLVLIPPGEFMMGSPKELIEEELNARGDDQWYEDHLPGEGPQHRVRITKPFYLGMYDVTQEEYQRVMGTNPSEFSVTGRSKDKVAGQDTKRFPVETVSWQDADEFCSRLSEVAEEKSAGRRYRLPSEAQWEYACRAGSTGRWFFSPASSVRTTPEEKEHEKNMFSDYGWFKGNSGGMTHAVGGRRASVWGLYDMHGNVGEWCQDWYDKYYYRKSPTDDPTGPLGGSLRVLRGGSWSIPARLCRSARRDSREPGYRDFLLGLRVSLVLPDTAAERVKISHATDAAQPSGGSTANRPSPVVANSDSQPAVHLPVIGSLVGADGKWKLPSGAPLPAIAPFRAAKAKEHQAAWAKHLGVPVELTNSIGMKLVLVPPGEFDMGSTPGEISWALKEGKNNKERQWYFGRVLGETAHHVRITRPFYLAMYHVTQGEYEKVTGVNPSAFTEKQVDSSAFKPSLSKAQAAIRPADANKVAGKDTSRHPVETVDWEDASAFCRTLSAMPLERAAGRVYRLPTEAEWEYACRAGTTTRWACGDDESRLSEYAWFSRSDIGTTLPVGLKKPNAWGLYDMHGNVWQWCADLFSDDYYKQSRSDDPPGSLASLYRVLRGGRWDSTSACCRSAFRNRHGPTGRNRDFGFRVVLDR